MTRFSEAKHRSVLDLATAKSIGRVDGFLVDAANQRVRAVRVGKHKGGSFLGWEGVQAFGPDAITVRSGDDIGADPADAGGELVGGRVLTTRGHQLGNVDDVTFDPTSSALEWLHLAGGMDVPANHLIAVGSYAVIVHHPQAATG